MDSKIRPSMQIPKEPKKVPLNRKERRRLMKGKRNKMKLKI